MSAEAQLTKLGIELPEPPPAQGNLVQAVRHGQLLYLSGQGTLQRNGQRIVGKLGQGCSLSEGYSAARVAAINLLSAMRAELGSLDRVEKIVKVFGMVNADPEFLDHPKVINGCSDLFESVFGEAGRHARSAVGMASLPNGISVEIEAIVAIRDDGSGGGQ